MKIVNLSILFFIFYLVIFISLPSVCLPQFDFSQLDSDQFYQQLQNLTPDQLQDLCYSTYNDLETLYLTGQYPTLLSKIRILIFGGSILGNEIFEADGFYYSARVLSRQGKESQALQYLYRAYPIFEKNHEISRQIKALEVMIRTTQNLNLWQDAKNYTEKLTALSEQSNDDYGKVSSLLNQGVLSYHEKKIEEAEKKWVEIIQIDPNGQFSEITGLAYNHLAHIYLMKGNTTLAQQHFTEAFKLAERNQNRFLEFVLRLNYAEFLANYKYKFEMAIQSLNRCQQLIHEMDLTYQRLWVQNNLAVIYTQLGEFGKARYFLEEALSYQNQAGIPEDIGVLFNLGVLYWHLGQLDDAEKYLIRAQQHSEIQNDILTHAKVLANLGTIYKTRGNEHKAFDYYQKALAIFEELNMEIEIADLMNNLANLNFQLGDLESAKKSLLIALQTYFHHSLISSIAQAQINLGYIELENDRIIPAKLNFSRALAGAKKTQNLPLIFYAHLGLAEVSLKNQDNDQAIQYLYEAIEVIEETRGKMENVKDQICFTENRLTAYDTLIKELNRQGRNIEAFDVSERVKSRSFLDIVSGHDIQVKPKDQEMYETIQNLYGTKEFLQNKKSELLNQSQSTSNSLELFQINQLLQDVENKLNTLLIDYKTISPELLSLMTVNTFPLSELQAQINPDVLIIDYYVLEEKTLIWIMSNDSFATIHLPLGEKNLQPLIFQLRGSLSDYKSQEYFSNIDDLSKKIIEPLLGFFDKKKHIVIIPHRSLSYIPFQVLRANGHYLVENYAVSYAPSLNAYCYSVQKKSTEKSSLLAFGNPAINDPSFIPLPGAETEVKEIAQLFNQPTIYIGPEATETQLLQNAFQFDIIHLSTHALSDEQFPMYSFIVLAPDQKNDGFLFAHEVFQLSLSSNLVVLSACQTALGQLSPSEGLVGLSRSFFYAGTPSLIASLWNVSDQSTMELFIYFYKYWFQGYSKSQALQMAQKVILNKYPHPYFWAPFILIGYEQ